MRVRVALDLHFRRKCPFSKLTICKFFPKCAFPMRKTKNSKTKNYQHTKQYNNKKKGKNFLWSHRTASPSTTQNEHTKIPASSPPSPWPVLPGLPVLSPSPLCQAISMRRLYRGSTAALSESDRPPHDHDGHRSRSQATPVMEPRADAAHSILCMRSCVVRMVF